LIIKHKHYITSIHEQLDRDPKGWQKQASKVMSGFRKLIQV
jgi:hypothetical protein